VSEPVVTTILEIRKLTTEFVTDGGRVLAVEDLSLSVPEGAVVGVVGESGCGKTVTALSVMRLIPSPPGRVVSGEILYRGQNLLALSESEMRRIRGNRISMIFQDPASALNPVFTVGEQIAEAVREHQGAGRKLARQRAIEMLGRVGIPAPEERVDFYPHQMSGGMQQRVLIAIALACNPDLLIADEPTTALDVTVQAQIIDLIRKLRGEGRMAVLWITHDLGVVAETCDEVAVMYAGKLVERAPCSELFAKPLHPYTAGLLRSRPNLGDFGDDPRAPRRLRAIPGVVPDLGALPPGCRFRDRCERGVADCAVLHPKLAPVEGGGGRDVACYNPVGTSP
jgi:peptide/nickel transport system ATP-binding protein